MNRKVLLLEPPYKNKYPPMGLMKLAAYFRKCNDTVRFFKGNLRDLALSLLSEEFFAEIDGKSFSKYFPSLREYIRTGKSFLLDNIPDFCNLRNEILIQDYRKRFRSQDYPKFDIIAVTTLFTFCWKETIDTINGAKSFLKPEGRILVGGVAASLVPEEIYRETKIFPVTGLLNRPGMIDSDNDDIIDTFPQDYSILEETEYEYPSKDAYFAYTTRGCIRNCSFCAVPILEPEYKKFCGIYEQIKYIDEHYGMRKDLLLMDNNVLASDMFDEIIDEIKRCGFAKNASYIPPDEYDIALRNLQEGFNQRAYVRKIISIYDFTASRMHGKDAGEFCIFREKNGLLYPETAAPESILAADSYFRPLRAKYFHPAKRSRYVDFNQGIDARLITDSNMKRLAEINIRPLRIAFDHYDQREIYINAVRTAARWGIDDLSDYLLYNYDDEPEELYYRMRINVDLCEELDVKIYSFPMKYHPVRDPQYFRNRDYIGIHWNKKFIRAVQAVMNSTKGKIGRGVKFFEAAFGRDINEFHEIMYMPETFIIYREKYKHTLAEEWLSKFRALNESDSLEARTIIQRSTFTSDKINHASETVRDVLQYYLIDRE